MERQTTLNEYWNSIEEKYSREKINKILLWIEAGEDKWIFDTHDLDFNFDEILQTYCLYDLTENEIKILREELRSLAEQHQTRIVSQAIREDNDFYPYEHIYKSKEDKD